MATMKSLRDLYIHELKDIYSAEKQLTKALPKMSKAARSPELQQAFADHLQETKRHVERIEQIFASYDEKPGGVKCKGMEGLIEEGEELLKEKDVNQDVLDAGLIAAAQRVEHYEIAAYGTVITYAKALGEKEAIDLLKETIDEEKAADKKLTNIATSGVNRAAKLETRMAMS